MKPWSQSLTSIFWCNPVTHLQLHKTHSNSKDVTPYHFTRQGRETAYKTKQRNNESFRLSTLIQSFTHFSLCLANIGLTTGGENVSYIFN